MANYRLMQDISGGLIICEGFDSLEGECRNPMVRFVEIPTRIKYDDGSSGIGNAEMMLCELHEPMYLAYADK